MDRPEDMPVYAAFVAGGEPRHCPKFDTMIKDKDGKRLVTDVSQPRTGCRHLWCTACISLCVIESMRTPQGIFKCPREGCLH